LELARIIAAGPPAGTGIDLAAWRSWHEYEFFVCPRRGITCDNLECKVASACLAMREIALDGNGRALRRRDRPKCRARNRQGETCAVARPRVARGQVFSSRAADFDYAIRSFASSRPSPSVPAIWAMSGLREKAPEFLPENIDFRFPCASHRLTWEAWGVQIGAKPLKSMARPKGFEPLTPRFVVWCSIQLSYGRGYG
jgi:hypothetical protein